MNSPALHRRTLLNRFGLGLGGLALNEMLAKESGTAPVAVDRGVLGGTHHFAKAKRIIYLFMSGGPSQPDLFDPKDYIKRIWNTPPVL